ncbi:hypothetical protein DYB34_003471 [Aphanomyces astaci]|uniref:Uncharacterized protein n=1 Tax=Aphanomyces astaci TaxID=112090 RepID=A0A3R6ZBW3_APHAT|nr:hypothetical protein DYB34_003471 [Aphanomyces astaci]
MEVPVLAPRDGKEGCQTNCWQTLHLSPGSDVALIRALLRWGEGKCQRSLEHLKSLDLPIVNRLISATATVAGRIGLQGWVDSIVQCCDPLTAALDKFLAQNLLTTLAFALDQSSQQESGRERGLEERIMQLELHVEELHTKWLNEVHDKEQVVHELHDVRRMNDVVATSHAATVSKLEDQLALLKRKMVADQEAMATGSDLQVGHLESELAVAKQQCGRLQDEKAVLSAKLARTEQKLVWAMLLLTIRSQNDQKTTSVTGTV